MISKKTVEENCLIRLYFHECLDQDGIHFSVQHKNGWFQGIYSSEGWIEFDYNCAKRHPFSVILFFFVQKEKKEPSQWHSKLLSNILKTNAVLLFL